MAGEDVRFLSQSSLVVQVMAAVLEFVCIMMIERKHLMHQPAFSDTIHCIGCSYLAVRFTYTILSSLSTLLKRVITTVDIFSYRLYSSVFILFCPCHRPRFLSDFHRRMHICTYSAT